MATSKPAKRLWSLGFRKNIESLPDLSPPEPATSSSTADSEIGPLRIGSTSNVSTGATIPEKKPHQPIPDLLRDAANTLINPGYSFRVNRQDGMKPVAYAPLSGIAIFPVLRHGKEKAFGDIPDLFAREYSAALSLKAPAGTRVYTPSDTIEMIRLRGLGHIYDQVMQHYIKAGRPDPNATDYLIKQFAEDGQTISRIMFVESDLDMNSPDHGTGLLDRVSALMTDGTPKYSKAMLHSRIQVFDAESPGMPRLWAGSWQRSVTMNNFRNMTPSVFDNNDSERVLSGVSRRMSQEMLIAMPRESYMAPVYDNKVHGRLISPKSNTEHELSAPSN